MRDGLVNSPDKGGGVGFQFGSARPYTTADSIYRTDCLKYLFTPSAEARYGRASLIIARLLVLLIQRRPFACARVYTLYLTSF